MSDIILSHDEKRRKQNVKAAEVGVAVHQQQEAQEEAILQSPVLGQHKRASIGKSLTKVEKG